MKKKWVISASLFFSFFSFYYIGCNKTDHPFGVYAPNGLDVPTVTATPLAGAIDVFVVENNSTVSGVTVNLKDPNGNFLTAVATGNGAAAYAPFSPFPVTTGTWLAEVYTQGHYLDSTQSFNVTGGQTSVTFTAGVVGLTAPTFSSGPQNQQYQTGNGTFTYGVTYTQPGNLSIPVSVELLNVLPTGFASSPSTFVLGAAGPGVDQSPVIISKTACYTVSVPVTFGAFDFLGTKVLNSTVFNVTRGFQIPLSVSVSGTSSTVGCGGPCSSTTINYSINLTSTSDCNHSYPLNAWGTVTGNGGATATVFNVSPSLISGGSYSGTASYNGNATNQTIHVTVTSPVGPTTGAVAVNTTFSGTAVNTNY